MPLQAVTSLSKYSRWRLLRLWSVGIRIRLARVALPPSVYPPMPSASLHAVAPNCANMSRCFVNDGYRDGICHLVSFDHSPKPFESVVHLKSQEDISVNSGRMIVTSSMARSFATLLPVGAEHSHSKVYDQFCRHGSIVSSQTKGVFDGRGLAEFESMGTF